jgi:endonuclease-3
MKNDANSVPSNELKTHARKILKALKAAYPEPSCALVHKNAYELIVATILSAQCTDARVNLVTPALFARYPDPKELAQADQDDVEKLIRSTGFFRSKAKHLIGMGRAVMERHDGEIPPDLDFLTSLPGVGRKTAHVVLGNAFGMASGIVVDTHVKRLAYRLGMTTQTDPVRVEAELVKLIPRSEWVDFSHRLIEHGRGLCNARKPNCRECFLLKICPRVGLATLPSLK